MSGAAPSWVAAIHLLDNHPERTPQKKGPRFSDRGLSALLSMSMEGFSRAAWK
jgi:hypothetical protein